jgi:hypothetical protein
MKKSVCVIRISRHHSCPAMNLRFDHNLVISDESRRLDRDDHDNRTTR